MSQPEHSEHSGLFREEAISAIDSVEKFDEAIAIFQHNVELYPGSANVYDSLADGYEGVGKLELALQNCEKAVEVGTKTNDHSLDSFKDHRKRVAEKVKTSGAKAAEQR